MDARLGEVAGAIHETKKSYKVKIASKVYSIMICDRFHG